MAGEKSLVGICQKLPTSGITCGLEKNSFPATTAGIFFSNFFPCSVFFFLFVLNLFLIIAWRVLSCLYHIFAGNE